MLQAFEVATIHQQEESEPYMLLIWNIYKGKTNQKDLVTILQAKSIYHKHPKILKARCLGNLLFTRFCVHDKECDLSKTVTGWRSEPLYLWRTVPYQTIWKIMKDSNVILHKTCLVFEHFRYSVSHIIHFVTRFWKYKVPKHPSTLT